jgi:hypothetical protein
VAFGLLFLILLVRPQGLFGARRVREVWYSLGSQPIALPPPWARCCYSFYAVLVAGQLSLAQASLRRAVGLLGSRRGAVNRRRTVGDAGHCPGRRDARRRRGCVRAQAAHHALRGVFIPIAA